VNTGSKRGVGVERESQKDRMKEGRNKICRERERERENEGNNERM